MAKKKNYKAIIERIIQGDTYKLDNKNLSFIAFIYNEHIIKGNQLNDQQKETILKINRDILEGKR